MIAELIAPIIEEELKGKKEHIYYPRPSIAGTERCLRQMVYWGLRFAKQPLPGRAIMNLEDSSLHEIMTIDRINLTVVKHHSGQLGVDCAELPFTSYGFPEGHKWHCKICNKDILITTLHGHIDGILTDLAMKDWLWEHKALSHFGFMGMWDRKEMPVDYITQTCLYWLGLLKLVEKLHGIILTIKNKNTSALIDLDISYNPKTDTAIVNTMKNHLNEIREVNQTFENIVGKALKRFADAERYMKTHPFEQGFSGANVGRDGKLPNYTKEIPPREYDIDHWRCGYCPYGAICWEGWQEEIEGLKTIADFSNQEVDTAGLHYNILSEQTRELNRQLSKIEKERKIAKRNLVEILKQSGIREGKSKQYNYKLWIQHKKAHETEPKDIVRLDVKPVKKEEKKDDKKTT